MKLSFVKTVEGHEVEFVRLMYPLRYDIFVRVANATPFKLAVKKDATNVWVADGAKELPGWYNEISLGIHEAIEENEADATNG